MIKIKIQRVPVAELSLYAVNTLHTSVLIPGDLVGTKKTLKWASNAVMFRKGCSWCLNRKQLCCDLSLFTSLPVLSVTVCPCNVRGNCKIAAKQLQGMPTIQSAVGILLGTFAVIGRQKTQVLFK